MTALIIAIVVVALVAVWVIGTYNRLVRSRNRVRNAWSHVDVQLKRRYDLVPNLVETVKGYAAHEASTLNAVIEARNAAQAAGSVDAQAAAEGGLTGALRHLFALAEAYPDLKASGNYRTLQTQLDEIEGDIAIARQIYNDTVLTYNNTVQQVPTNIVASLTGFKAREFYDAGPGAEEAPEVSF